MGKKWKKLWLIKKNAAKQAVVEEDTTKPTTASKPEKTQVKTKKQWFTSSTKKSNK